MDNELIIKNIEKLIEEGSYNEADNLINRYVKVMGYDDDIYSMIVVNEIFKGNLNKAADFAKAGLKNNIYNPDLYTNLAYIYEMYESYDKAYICYNHALKLTNQDEKVLNIKENINDLKKRARIKVKQYSIILTTHNNIDNVKVCIESIRRNIETIDAEIVVVDNNSIDGTREWLKDQTGIRCVLNDEDKGIAALLNQGISIADKDSDIFILSSNCILMPNTILNLQLGLYSNEEIGAAASVMQDTTNVTNRITTYKDAVNYSLKNNVPESRVHKFKMKVESSSLMIKRDVINKVEKLDESFTIQDIFDEDLSYRILELKYKLICCEDSYLVNLENEDIVNNKVTMNKELDKLCSKWGINKYNSFIRYEFIFLLSSLKIGKGNVLHINSGTGSTLLEAKNFYGGYNFFGVEENEAFLSAYKGSQINDIKTSIDEYEENFFDVIFMDIDSISADEGQVYLERVRKLLKSEGSIIMSLGMNKDSELSRNNDSVVFKDIYDIGEFIKGAGLGALNIIPYFEVKNKMENIFGSDIFKTVHYRNFSRPEACIIAENYIDIDEVLMRKVIFMLRRIEFDVKVDEAVEELIKFILSNEKSFVYIRRAVETLIYSKDYVLKYLAEKCKENDIYNEALKIWLYLYEKNPKEKEICRSIGETFKCLGQDKQAEEYSSLAEFL